MDRDTAIRNTHPSVVTIEGEKEAFDQDGNIVKLKEKLITKELERIQNEYDLQEYSRKRKAEYPLIEDQLDIMYHQGYDGWKKMIQEIKTKYPKPEEE